MPQADERKFCISHKINKLIFTARCHLNKNSAHRLSKKESINPVFIIGGDIKSQSAGYCRAQKGKKQSSLTHRSGALKQIPFMKPLQQFMDFYFILNVK